MNSFILSAALAVGRPDGVALPDQDAPRYLAKAIYKEAQIDIYVSKLEKKYIKIDDYPVVGYIGFVARLASERRLTLNWRF